MVLYPQTHLILQGSGQDSDGDTLQSPSNVCLLSRAIAPIAKKTTGIHGEPLEEGIAQIVYYQAGVALIFGLITKFSGNQLGKGPKKNIRKPTDSSVTIG